MSVPNLEPEQRRAAADKAIEARRERAALKQALKAGTLGLPDVLRQAEGSAAIAKMRVADVLCALPSYGPATAKRLMEQLDISQTRRVRGLGPRQREALLQTLRGDG